jgi:hypothetical protein
VLHSPWCRSGSEWRETVHSAMTSSLLHLPCMFPPTTTTTPGPMQFSTWAARCGGARCAWSTRRHEGGGDKALELRELLGEEVERLVARSKMRWWERMAARTKLLSLSLSSCVYSAARLWNCSIFAAPTEADPKQDHRFGASLENIYDQCSSWGDRKKKCISWGPLPTHWT